jgi:hypothetical protein
VLTSWWTRMHIPKSAALQQVEQQWTTSSVFSWTDILVTRLIQCESPIGASSAVCSSGRRNGAR